MHSKKKLVEINRYSITYISDVLPNYSRYIPRLDEYVLIINGLLGIAAMQRFVNFRDQQEIDTSTTQTNDIQQPSLQSEEGGNMSSSSLEGSSANEVKKFLKIGIIVLCLLISESLVNYKEVYLNQAKNIKIGQTLKTQTKITISHFYRKIKS